MKIQDLLIDLRNDKIEGFTLDIENMTLLKKGELKGYLVGVTNNKVIVPMVTPSYFERFCDSVRLLETSGQKYYIGGWKDSKGNLYLDISVNIIIQVLAEALKILYNQESIFNLETWKCE